MGQHLQIFQFHQSPQQLPLYGRWHILWHAPRPGLPFVQVKEASQLPTCPSSNFLPVVQGKMVCSMLQTKLGQLMYSGIKTGNAPIVICPTAGCPILWSQPESTALRKHCWCINEFTAGQSASIYFWNIKSRISVTTCIIIAWIPGVAHFSTYATKLGLSRLAFHDQTGSLESSTIKWYFVFSHL